MQVVDSKDVNVSLLNVAKFPAAVLSISLLFFLIAYFFLFGVFQIVLYINTVIVLISIIYSILFGLIPLGIKRRQTIDNSCCNTELVSILIPVFNDGDILEKNLQNLVKLRYPNYEILIVYSEKSTDRTQEVALRYTNSYPNIRMFAENISKGNALNIGIQNAKGEFILILDSDTFIYDGFIERAMSYFVDENIKCVTSVWLGLNASQNLITTVQFAMTSNMNFYSVGTSKYMKNVGFGGFGGILRRSALIECNGFVITPSEEAEFSRRVNIMFPKWRGICDDQLFCYQYFTPDIKTLYLQQVRWTKGNWKYNLKGIGKFFSQTIGRKFINLSSLFMVIVFPMFGIFTTGMSIVQFFANFFVPNLNFGGGVFFFLLSQVALYLGFTALFLFIYPKYRGQSAVILSRKRIFIAVFLIMFVCGFIFGIIALNSLKELLTQGKRDVFIKVDKSNLF